MAETMTGAMSAGGVAPDSRVPTDPNGVVKELPCGLVREAALYRHAEFVPMAGVVRRMISKKDVRDDFVRVTDIVLRQCVRRVGPLQVAEHAKMLDDMTLADRDFLLMEIRRVSSGDELKALVHCGMCKKRIQITFKLDELTVVRPREGDAEIHGGRLCFRVRSASPAINALCRYPIGSDQPILEGMEKNPTEVQYRLYAACLVEWGGKPGPYEAEFFDALPVGVIDEFTRQFAAKKPGPILDQRVSCANKACGADIEFSFEGSDFFFPLPTRGSP